MLPQAGVGRGIDLGGELGDHPRSLPALFSMSLQFIDQQEMGLPITSLSADMLALS